MKNDITGHIRAIMVRIPGYDDREAEAALRELAERGDYHAKYGMLMSPYEGAAAEVHKALNVLFPPYRNQTNGIPVWCPEMFPDRLAQYAEAKARGSTLASYLGKRFPHLRVAVDKAFPMVATAINLYPGTIRKFQWFLSETQAVDLWTSQVNTVAYHAFARATGVPDTELRALKTLVKMHIAITVMYRSRTFGSVHRKWLAFEG